MARPKITLAPEDPTPLRQGAGLAGFGSTSKPVTPSTDRRVHSYKIPPAVGTRLRKLAHRWDRPIGEVAEQAILEFLHQHEEEAG